MGVANWRENAAELRRVLLGSKVADIPQLVAEWRAILKKWLISTRRVPAATPDHQRQSLIAILVSVFAVVLLDAGWRVDSTLGEKARLVKEANSLKPFRLIHELGSATVSSAQFGEFARNLGIADLPLGIFNHS